MMLDFIDSKSHDIPDPTVSPKITYTLFIYTYTIKNNMPPLPMLMEMISG
jgi:hypothetical protein